MAPNTKSSSSRSNAAGTYVALLRGINVGGKNMLPMRDLAALFSEAGCRDVRTFIQSGNVVFTAALGSTICLPQLVSQKIAERFGFRAPVVLRTVDELREVAAHNPFLGSGAETDTGTLHVAFLAEAPDQSRVAALNPQRSPGDSFELRGREIYLCLPHGVAKSKLTNAYFDSQLATTSTLRNWRTVLKLVEMTQSAG